MPPELLETFEHKGRMISIYLEEDASNPDWWIVRAYNADGTPVNPFIYSVRKKKRQQMISNGEEDPIQEFVRSVHFDLKSEAESKVQQTLEETLRGVRGTAHKVKCFYEHAQCQIKIMKRDDL